MAGGEESVGACCDADEPKTGRGGGRLETIGAKAEEQGVDVAWVREREGALGAIVSEGKAQEFGCNGMGFDSV